MKVSKFFVLLLLMVLSACAQPTSTPTAIPFVPPSRVPTKTRVPASPTALPSPTETSTPLPTLEVPPWQQRSAPRTLIDADDIARIKQWIATYSWARDARDQIIKNADAWPTQYLKDFNLTSPDLPPGGGQWTMWYVCPNGLPLRYEPTHSPPHYCPSTNQYFASPPQWPNRPALYDQVIYARRHDAFASYARFLGLAYALTGDVKYANRAATILRAYAAAYPKYPHHDKDGNIDPSGAKAHAQTLDEATWLVDIAWSYDLISSALAPTDRAAIADNVLRPAIAEIEGNRAGLSNWQAWHNAAIATVGFALNDASLVELAYNDPAEGFFKQLTGGAVADGFWWEGSWGYHFCALNAMLYLAEMGTRAGIDTYGQPDLRAMWTAPLQMALPDLSLPRFGDDSGRSLASEWMYEVGYRRYLDPLLALPISKDARTWQSLLWGAVSLPTASPLPATSTLLPEAGYAILRSGDTNALRYLAFKFGPSGGGHGHMDELGYVAYGAGKLLGLDPGVHSYAADAYNGWDKTTVAHNTIVVDELTQGTATGNLRRYFGFSALSLVSGDAGAVYPNRAALARTLALTPDYWLDLTRATTLDGQSHRFDWIYHNSGTLTTPLRLSSYTALPNTNGYNYLTNARSTAVSGDWEALWDLGGSAHVDLRMLGVFDTTVVVGNGIDQTNQAIPFAMARRQTKDTTFTALFEPYGTSSRITRFYSSGAGLHVVAPGAFEDAILLADDSARGQRLFDEFSTDAAVAYVRQDSNHTTQVFVVANGTRLSGGLHTLFTSNVPITLQVAYTGDTMAITVLNPPTARLRIYAATTTRVTVNGTSAGFAREGEMNAIALPQ